MPRNKKSEVVFQGIGIPIEAMIVDKRFSDDTIRLEFKPMYHYGHVIPLIWKHRPRLAAELFHTFDFSKN